MSKFKVTIHTGEREVLILPRRKGFLFLSLESAKKTLEKKGKQIFGQGRIYDYNNNLIYTIAL